MATDVSNISTLQDVINVLSVLFFNMNEIERVYYDIFINPEPLMVEVQRYNDQGVLETISVPNRAMMAITVLTGNGAPNGSVSASVGSFYLNTEESSLELYYKSTGADSYGWVKFWSTINFQEGENYLSPTGDASQLTNLNMSNAGSGTLAVGRGGTGATSITGLVKGNGAAPFSAAVEGVDYIGAGSMVGLIAFYPVNSIPTGWLRCDGAAYNRVTYARLFNKIGTIYGSGDGSTTFNVPNLFNHFIRCWDGTSPFNTAQAAQVGGHSHGFSGTTSIEDTNHTHTRGTMNITGKFPVMQTTKYFSGAFYCDTSVRTLKNDNSNGDPDYQAIFDAARSWEGETSIETAPHAHQFSGTTADNNEGAENRVLNKMLIPVIKF